MNEKKLDKIAGKSFFYTAEIKGQFPEHAYPTYEELELKKGAQVMFIKNDSDVDKRYFNGKIGTVISIDKEELVVRCPGDDFDIKVTPEIWENIKYSIDANTKEINEAFIGSFEQIPLRLAWAITIHKSQGLTFEKAIIDAEASFAHGQVYVALSRCKTLEGMVLSTPISNRSIINDETVQEFITNVEENPPGEKELNEAKLAFQKEQVLELFRFYRSEYLLKSIVRLINEKKGSFPETTVSHLAQLKKQADAEIFEVANKFRKKITDYLTHEPDVDKNQKLQERIKKAATYFYEKVEKIIVNGFKKTDTEIDNREVKKQFKRYVTDLKEDCLLKISAFEECKSGFDVAKIMNAKAKALVSKSKSSARVKAKELNNYDKVSHPELFELLRSYRAEKAVEKDLPHYMIFSQKVLYELTTYLPVDLVSLKLINGMGAKKIEQFGSDIIQIIKDYSVKNKIEISEIPLQPPVKEKKPKVDTKKVSFEFFKAGKTIAEIAKIRALTSSTIENHLAYYVKTGELDVLQLIDQEKIKKITRYFNQAEDKSFAVAKNHFGNDVSYGELRIVLSYMELETND